MIEFTFSWSLVVYTVMTLFIGFALGIGVGVAGASETKKVR